MRNKAKRNYKKDFVAPKVRRTLLRHMQRTESRVADDAGTTVDVSPRQCCVSSGTGKDMHSRVLPTWILRNIGADFVGAKVRVKINSVSPDMIILRVERVGPTIPLMSPRSKRRFTKRDEQLLQRAAQTGELE